MAHCSLHRMFPSLDIEHVMGYPNHVFTGWGNNCPKFDAYLSLDIAHVVNLLRYVSEIDVAHQDVLIRLFFLSLKERKKDWFKDTLNPKSIFSLTIFIEEFLKRWALRTQRYKNILHDLTTTLQREGLSSDLVKEDEESFDKKEFEEKIHEEGFQPLEEEQ
jgi:hypothetical protein